MSAGWIRVLFVEWSLHEALLMIAFSLATIGRPQPQYDALEKTQALIF